MSRHVKNVSQKRITAQIVAAFRGEQAALGGALDKRETQKVGLVDVLEGLGLLMERGGEGPDPSGATAE
jgi:hypothetical protein